MNREILFRGKRVDNGEWVEGYYYKFNDKPYICGQEDTFGRSYCHEIIPETVGQFIGLTDKNRTKIFEGDRLRHLRKYNTGHISVCSVVFRNGGFHLYYGNFIYETCELINRTDYSFEVIGNIHDKKRN